MGPELMQLMKEQAVRFATEVVSERVEKLTQIEGGFELEASGKTYHARTVILATGATARRLGLESEKALYGKGVSACATCDGFFFKNKNVMIVGGGDSAMEEANFLTRFATKVTLVHRRDSFRASKIMQDRTLSNPKISVLWNSEITDIKDVVAGKVTGVVIRNTVTGEISEQPIDGVFAAIGHEPNTDLVKGLVDVDQKGYISIRPGTTITNIPGLFASGDVQDARYRQAITAAGSGCMAALDVEKYLQDHHE
jgi:thioredoxin reductase (NADPH)